MKRGKNGAFRHTASEAVPQDRRPLPVWFQRHIMKDERTTSAPGAEAGTQLPAFAASPCRPLLTCIAGTLHLSEGDIRLSFRQGDDIDRFSDPAQDPFDHAPQEGLADDALTVSAHDDGIAA